MNEADAKIMELKPKHIKALDEAETLISPPGYRPYLELRALLPDPSPPARDRFRSLFTSYYGLNTGGLTAKFKDEFFAILFGGEVIVEDKPDFESILSTLSKIKSRNGNYAMPFSFVSKLVGIHLESSPIYDKHVLNFFGQKAPAASVDKSKRIEWYVGFLNDVSCSYTAWANDSRVKPILERLRARDDRLNNCHDVRTLDFLVWKVGNKKLLT